MSAVATKSVTFPPQPAYDAGTLALKGPRVTLRRPLKSDADDVFKGMNDIEVVKNLSRAPWPYMMHDAVSWLDGIENAGPERTAYPFAIVTGGRQVGTVGISNHGETVELGYWIGRDAWGRGFATEAARLAVGFAFTHLDLEELEAGHFVDNAASGRVLEKLGFAYTQTVARFSKARDCDVDCRMMILPRTRFAAGQNDSEGGTDHGG
ncbi:MAG: GNAT family N-acetyltransferase [Hyphomicrobiaceae bacterium]|nr:GNAT family N-acetyltransferase [Hyphomicrobiaceae bacterium]